MCFSLKAFPTAAGPPAVADHGYFIFLALLPSIMGVADTIRCGQERLRAGGSATGRALIASLSSRARPRGDDG